MQHRQAIQTRALTTYLPPVLAARRRRRRRRFLRPTLRRPFGCFLLWREPCTGTSSIHSAEIKNTSFLGKPLDFERQKPKTTAPELWRVAQSGAVGKKRCVPICTILLLLNILSAGSWGLPVISNHNVCSTYVSATGWARTTRCY